VLHITLDGGIVETTADKTLCIEKSVLGVHGNLVLGCITDETLGVGEGDVRGGSAVTLIVGDDLNTIILPDTNTTEGGTQINTNSG